MKLSLTYQELKERMDWYANTIGKPVNTWGSQEILGYYWFLSENGYEWETREEKDKRFIEYVKGK